MYEIPEEHCKHTNEKVIANGNDPYRHTHIQCQDCGSVRMLRTHSQQRNLSHDETL